MPLLIKGGRLIDPVSGTDEIKDVLIDGGVITDIGDINVSGASEIIDATGMVVAPGLIDIHTHLREPGREDEETVASASAAAVRGGFTTITAMPNTDPVSDSGGIIRMIIEMGEKAGLARVEVVGAITKSLAGDEITPFDELVESGAIGLSDDGVCVSRSDVMRRALEYGRLVDVPLLLHEEDPLLSKGGQMHEGVHSTRLGLQGIPGSAEDTIVARDISLAEEIDHKIHIQHVSTAKTVELIRAAKKRGVSITAEATPHHLTLTDSAIAGEGRERPFDTNLKVNPPLRTDADRLALIEGVADGTIDAIATDHATHSREEKEEGFDKAPCGMIGLETAFAVINTHLVGKGLLSLAEVIARMSSGPASVLGLDRGSIRKGAVADLTVLDPESKWTVDESEFASKSSNSPYIGWELNGKVIATIVAGRKVFDAEKVKI